MLAVPCVRGRKSENEKSSSPLLGGDSAATAVTNPQNNNPFMNSLQLTKETLYTYRNYKNFDFKNHFIFKTIVDDKQYFNIPNNENKDICYLQEIFDELEEMQENCDFYLLRCDVNNKILKADKIFSDSINEDETINMELIYNCLDFYREAYITINSWNKDSSPDIELEAILSSKLGYILFKVFDSF